MTTIRNLSIAIFAIFALGLTTTACVEEGSDNFSVQAEELAAPGSCGCNSGGTLYGDPIPGTNDCLIAANSSQCADVTCQRPRKDNPRIIGTFGCNWSSGTSADDVEEEPFEETELLETSID